MHLHACSRMVTGLCLQVNDLGFLGTRACMCLGISISLKHDWADSGMSAESLWGYTVELRSGCSFLSAPLPSSCWPALEHARWLEPAARWRWVTKRLQPRSQNANAQSSSPGRQRMLPLMMRTILPHSTR